MTTNFIEIPTKNNIANPSKIIVKPVPKSGCDITKNPGKIIKQRGIMYVESFSSWTLEIWSKYFAKIRINANFINSDGWKFIPLIVIHLWTFPVPVNFTKISNKIPRQKDITLNLKKIFDGMKAKISIKVKPNDSLIKWFLAQGSQLPPDAEYKEVIPTKPNIITLKIINQLIFDNFDKKILLSVVSENLL